MKLPSHLVLRHAALLSLLFLIGAALAPARAQTSIKLSGRLSEVDGVRVLHVWGTPHERGFAHGYLLAEEILRLFDGYLREVFRSDESLQAFDKGARVQLRMMNIPRPYADELRGMLAGIQSRLGDKARLDAFGRPIEYDDLVAINCIPELGRVGCSSFAAWGRLTPDGDTISGRNLDWHRLRVLQGTHLLIAYGSSEQDASVQDAEDTEARGAIGWISITWPGFIGCLTGMNADGVTVSMHDAPGGQPTAPFAFTPRGLALRRAVESAHAATAVEDVRKVLATHLTMVGNNIPISFPSTGKTAAAVFEYDGNLKKGMGLTVRNPEKSGKQKSTRSTTQTYLACTNHYVKRATPTACDRYAKIDQRLAELANNGDQVDLPEAWQILRSVACQPGPSQPLETYHSVVFEPNKRIMHVAFSTADKPAAENKPVRLDVARLLDRPEAAARR